MTHMRSFVRSMSALLAVGSVCTTHPSLAVATTTAGQAEINAEIARSRALYREAQAAFENGQYGLAQQKLLQAWAIRKTFDVAAALTQVDLELKQYRGAAEHAENCLRVFAPAESDATLKSVLEMYAEAKKHVGTVRIQAKPDGAEISTDGKLVGSAPLTSPVFLEPGEHSIQIRLANSMDSREMHIDAGREYDVGIELPRTTTGAPNASGATTPSSAAVASHSTLQRESEPRGYGRVYWTIGVGGAVTLAGVVTALVYHARANSKQDAAAAIQARTPTCTNVSEPDCDRLSALVSERNQANTNAQVLLGVAGAAAIATGIVTYLAWPAKTSANSVKTSAWVTATSAGLGLSTQF